MLAFLSGRNPTWDLPPCQRAATWCAVVFRPTRRASRYRGVDASRASIPRVLRALRVADATQLDVGRADAQRALEGARGFLETGVNAPAFMGPGQLVPAGAISYTLASLLGGDCQLPLGAPRARRKTTLTSGFAGVSIHWRHCTGRVSDSQLQREG